MTTGSVAVSKTIEISSSDEMARKQLAICGSLGALGVVLGKSIYYLPKEHIGLVQGTDGKVRKVENSGIQFHLPFVEHAKVIDVQQLHRFVTATVYTKDKHSIAACVSLKAQVDRKQVHKLLDVADGESSNITERLINALASTVMRDEIANYTIVELADKAEEVGDFVKQRILQSAAEFCLRIEQVEPAPFKFPGEFIRQATLEHENQLEDTLAGAALSAQKKP